MNTVTGNVYDTDFGFMDSRDPMSLLARTNAHMRCPDIAGNPVPGHVVPGASFAAYHGFYQTEALGVYGDTMDISDLNTSCQLLQEDWAMERARNMQIDQLAGQRCPLVTSDFELDSAREGIMPFYDTPDLPPVLGNFRDPWTENPNVSVEGFNLCDSPMEESAVAVHMHWDVLNPLEPSLGAQSILYNLYDDPSDFPRKCGWCVDGSPCNEYYPAGDNLKHSVSQHLSKTHNLPPAGGKSTQKCHWLGCAKKLKRESIVRHILTVHLQITTVCEGCGTFFARRDSLQRHMRNSCGAGKAKR